MEHLTENRDALSFDCHLLASFIIGDRAYVESCKLSNYYVLR